MVRKKYIECDYESLKGKCGVYALVDENGKAYVGSTNNLFIRIQTHNMFFGQILRSKIQSGWENFKIFKALMDGRKFHLRVIREFDIGTIDRKDLCEMEWYYVTLAGGVEKTYNARIVEGFHSNNTGVK